MNVKMFCWVKTVLGIQWIASKERGTYEAKKISLLCFDDKIYIKNNGCDGLALGY